MSQTAQKALLRNLFGEKLKNMSEDYILAQSVKVIDKVLRHPAYIASARISTYLSTPAEVNTIPILSDAFARSKQCFVPRFESKSNTMKMLQLKNMDDYRSLPVVMWNIKQPKGNEGREDAFETGGLDLVLVPGVAFTMDGRRLGHGKGYYDNYLRKLSDTFPKQAFAIGLALKEQIADDLPTTENDYKLDLVLFPD